MKSIRQSELQRANQNAEATAMNQDVRQKCIGGETLQIFKPLPNAKVRWTESQLEDVKVGFRDFAIFLFFATDGKQSFSAFSFFLGGGGEPPNSASWQVVTTPALLSRGYCILPDGQLDILDNDHTGRSPKSRWFKDWALSSQNRSRNLVLKL